MKVDQRLFKISPFWATRLKEIKSATSIKYHYPIPNLAKSELRMDQYGCCVVGEAYGFTSSYYVGNRSCDTCIQLSKEFIVFKGETTKEVIPRFEKLIKRFCNHVERYHQVNLS